jgi:hypothetical protein
MLVQDAFGGEQGFTAALDKASHSFWHDLLTAEVVLGLRQIYQ